MITYLRSDKSGKVFSDLLYKVKIISQGYLNSVVVLMFSNMETV